MIEISGASKVFGRGAGVHDIDLTADDGAVTALVGPNGSGKTTLLRIAAGDLAPDAGRVAVNGLSLRWRTDVLHQLGVNLDSFGVDRTQTARTHLLWQARAAGLGAADADDALRRVGLYEVRRSRLSSFSYGMLQRLGLASALLGDPQTIILDEPLNGLDAEGIMWLRELFTTLSEQGRCLLVASHIFGEVQATAARVVVMGAGRIVFTGTVDELIAVGDGGPRPFESAYRKLTAPFVKHHGVAG